MSLNALWDLSKIISHTKGFNTLAGHTVGNKTSHTVKVFMDKSRNHHGNEIIPRTEGQ